MERLGLQKKGYVGKSLVTYFRLRDLLKTILNLLDNGHGWISFLFQLSHPSQRDKCYASIRLER